MNNASIEQGHHPLVIIRPGLLDRLKYNSGIKSDVALARLIGISRATLQRYKSGEEPSLRAVVGISEAFGLSLGEVVCKPDTAQEIAS